VPEVKDFMTIDWTYYTEKDRDAFKRSDRSYAHRSATVRLETKSAAKSRPCVITKRTRVGGSRVACMHGFARDEIHVDGGLRLW
jgi:hypothetical protein